MKHTKRILSVLLALALGLALLVPAFAAQPGDEPDDAAIAMQADTEEEPGEEEPVIEDGEKTWWQSALDFITSKLDWQGSAWWKYVLAAAGIIGLIPVQILFLPLFPFFFMIGAGQFSIFTCLLTFIPIFGMVWLVQWTGLINLGF